MNTAATHNKATCPLSQAHRDAMAYIQDLAITITLQGVYSVSAEYSGVAHSFRVSVLLFSELAKENFKARQSFHAYLPGHDRLAGLSVLEELQATARELEVLLVTPEGGAA